MINKEFSKIMRPVVKRLNKSPLRHRLKSGDQKTDFFHMAKGMLKSSNISLKRSRDKVSDAYQTNKSSKIENIKINFTPSQSTIRGVTNYEEDELNNYVSNHSSTIRLVTDSD